METQLAGMRSEETTLGQRRRLLLLLRSYTAFIELHIAITFALVALSGAVLGESSVYHLTVFLLLRVGVTTLLLSVGAESWTNIIDHQIDASMQRTRNRPLPAGAITFKNASYLGAVLTILGLLLATTLGVVPLVFFTFAFFDNVIIYSLLTKQTTPWSIVLGAPVAPLVLWSGYSSVSIPISLPAFLLGFMLIGWIPVHIWVIAIQYRQDYRKANVPMAPIVWGRPVMTVAILVAGLLMTISAVATLLTISQLTFPHLLLLILVSIASLFCLYLAFMAAWKAKIFSSSIRGITLYLLLLLFVVVDFKL